MTLNSNLSGPEIGEINLIKLRNYLDGLRASGRSLPTDGTKPNISAIAKESGINRNAFYTNAGIRRLLAEFTGGEVGAAVDEPQINRYRIQVQKLERDKLQAEQKLAAAQAEVEELRLRLTRAEQELRRYKIIEEEVLMAGRRVIP